MFDLNDLSHGAVRLIGALIGVLVSMIMVAPDTSRAALYRFLVGLTMGFIFAPVIPNVYGMGFLAGDGTDFVLARGAATGFAVWFILEAAARLLSSRDWIVATAKAIIDLRAKGGK